MQNYIIGIDTGGTFTDAVIIDKQSKEIIATAKKPTTHYQLSVGTTEALAEILSNTKVQPEQIESVMISSTLATNAVVENKGGRVAVIVIGYVKHFKLPVKAVVFVKGGHNIIGEEEEPLDIDYLVELIRGLKNEVDGYGVCSAMSIKNPAHELVTEKAISMLDPKPVFCSHKISQTAGMQERAATAGLHAKLMPIMKDFVIGVESAMTELNLACQPSVIGGNGTPLDTAKAIEEAALTVASGPACSAYFGSTYCPKGSTALVIDVGGTTTDIALIENGQPLLTKQGCRVGRWKTHVEAVDMHTAGIGGDSLVSIDRESNVSIGPSRVTPLATAPDLPAIEDWLGIDTDNKLISLNLSAKDSTFKSEIIELLELRGPVTPAVIAKETGLGGIPLEKQLEQLAREQIIYEAGFTPTDALHVLGKLDLGCRETALKGAKVFARTLGITSKEFSELVLSKTEEHIETQILDYLVKHYWDKSISSFIGDRYKHPALQVNFKMKLPLIGLGAAARFLLPGVAENLSTTVSFPENCEVGNAVGAALIGLNNLSILQ